MWPLIPHHPLVVACGHPSSPWSQAQWSSRTYSPGERVAKQFPHPAWSRLQWGSCVLCPLWLFSEKPLLPLHHPAPGWLTWLSQPLAPIPLCWCSWRAMRGFENKSLRTHPNAS